MKKNARDLVTLWGGANSPLREYSCRQWSGLLNDFYKVRWQKFFAAATASLQTNQSMDLPAFDKTIAAWEWKWVNTEKAYPTLAKGNSVQVAEKMYKKYRTVIARD